MGNFGQWGKPDPAMPREEEGLRVVKLFRKKSLPEYLWMMTVP